MNNEEVFVLEFSDDEASFGAKYAKKEYGLSLDESKLKARATKILKRMHAEKPEKFPAARFNVLSDANIHPWDNNYGAWAGALGKMFNQRNSKKKTRDKKRKLSIPTVPVTQEEDGQLAWKF